MRRVHGPHRRLGKPMTPVVFEAWAAILVALVVLAVLLAARGGDA